MNQVVPTQVEINEVLSKDSSAQDISVYTNTWSLCNTLFGNLVPGQALYIDLGGGKSIEIPNIYNKQFDTKVLLSGQTTQAYNLPGSWYFSASGNDLKSLFYSSPSMASGYFTAQGKTYSLRTTNSSSRQGQAVIVVYHRETTTATPGNSDCSLTFNPSFPSNYCDKYMNLVLDSDKEYFELANGSIAQKTEQATVSMMLHAAMIENHLDHFFRIKLADNLGPYVPANFPDAISDLSGVTINLHPNGVDPYILTDYTDNTTDGAWNQLGNEWSFNEEKRGVDRDILQLFRARSLSYAGIVQSRNVLCNVLTTNGPPQESTCKNNIFDELNSRGLGVSLHDRLFLLPVQHDNVIHEILHALGRFGHTDSPCPGACGGGGQVSVTCQYETSPPDVDEFNRFYLTREEQEQIREALNDCGECHCTPLEMRNCSVETNFASARIYTSDLVPFFDCSPFDEFTVSVEICSDCYTRDYDLEVSFPNSRFIATPSPGFQIISPPGNSLTVYGLNGLSVSAGECVVLDFPTEIISVIEPGGGTTATINLKASTVVNARVSNSSDDVRIIVASPIQWVGGSLSNPVPISQLQNFPPNLPRGIIDVSGVIVIDEPLSSFDYVRFNFESDALLIVPDGNKLEITNAILSGCGTLWNGILVEKGGELAISESRVELARNAIVLNDGAVADISNSIFTNNRIAISMPGTTAGQTASQLTFLANTVQITEPTALFNQNDTYGIKAFQQKKVEVICSQGNENSFSGMEYGIYLEDCNANFRQNKFSDIDRSAFYVDGPAQPVTSNRLWNSGTFGPQPSIQNCRYGVESRGTASAYTFFQIMENCGIGVFSASSGFQIIKNNVMSDVSRIGIALGTESVSPGFASISDNSIDLAIQLPLPSSDVIGFGGIRISQLPGSNMSTSIVNNTINTANSLYDGILMVNARNTQVKENTITLNSQGFGTGIEIQGGSNNFIQCNNISAAALPTNLTLHERPAIFVENSAGNEISCNETDNTVVGVEFRGMGLNTDFSTTDFGTHKWALRLGHNGPDGPVLASIGPQLHKGNLWRNSPVGGGIQAFLNDPSLQNAFINRFTVDAPACANLLPTNNATAFNWFESEVSVSTETCTTNGIIPCNNGASTGCLNGSAGNNLHIIDAPERFIWGDSAVITDYEGIKEIAYQQLQTAIVKEYYAPNDTLNEFAAARRLLPGGLANYINGSMEVDYQSSTFVDFEAKLADYFSAIPDTMHQSFSGVGPADLDSLAIYAAELFDFQTVQDSITTNATSINTELVRLGGANSSEQLVALAHALYAGDTYSDKTLINIYSIAANCAELSGPYAYLNRSLFWQLYPDSTIVLDCNKIESSATIPVSPTKQSDGLSIYPNPSNGTFAVSAKLVTNQASITLDVVNNQGQRVFGQTYPTKDVSNFKTIIELNELPPGMYLLRLTQGTDVQTKRIIIR